MLLLKRISSGCQPKKLTDHKELAPFGSKTNRLSHVFTILPYPHDAATSLRLRGSSTELLQCLSVPIPGTVQNVLALLLAEGNL